MVRTDVVIDSQDNSRLDLWSLVFKKRGSGLIDSEATCQIAFMSTGHYFMALDTVPVRHWTEGGI